VGVGGGGVSRRRGEEWGDLPRAANTRVRVAEEMICTPEPTCTHSSTASLGHRKTSPLTIFHPLSSRSSFGPAWGSRL